MMTAAPVRDEHAEALLAALIATDVPLDATGLMLVFAHPDDETIACGGQLFRLVGAELAIVTDGAPINLADARRLGFSDAEAYAGTRSQELLRAAGIAGIGPDCVHRLAVPDQQAAFSLYDIAASLAKLFNTRATRLVITHAYEGGHPDHDAVAFAVHAAVEMRRRAGRGLCIVEAPLYRLGDNGILRGSFVAVENDREFVARLTEGQVRVKEKMLAAYETQTAVLAEFATECERFRIAPDYDFTVLPNRGRLLYERFPWGLGGSDWLEHTRAALAELSVEEQAC